MDNDKITAILNCHVPQSIKQLRGFLGLSDYYRLFIKHYPSIAQPLIDLLKKDQFQWSTTIEQGF